MPPTLSLVPATPTAISHRSNASYVRGALTSPLALAFGVFGTLLGISFAGLVGALVALCVVTTSSVLAARTRRVRAHLDRQEVLRLRNARENHRMRALRPAGPVRQAQYVELRDLVETLERETPSDAQRFDLQDMLDHFIRVSLAHQRCTDALRLAGTPDVLDPVRGKRKRALQARRARHREMCLRRIEDLRDELDAVDELIRLVAQRAACPAVIEPELDREIDRRLWELDEVDEALAQLSA